MCLLWLRLIILKKKEKTNKQSLQHWLERFSDRWYILKRTLMHFSAFSLKSFRVINISLVFRKDRKKMLMRLSLLSVFCIDLKTKKGLYNYSNCSNWIKGDSLKICDAFNKGCLLKGDLFNYDLINKLGEWKREKNVYNREI